MAGTRGIPTSLAALRDTPYATEHDTSVRLRPAPPQTFEACEAWFRDAWEASLPTRSHTRGVEDGSALGSPRMSGSLHTRTDHASDRGWGVTGWDKDGRPRGMTDDGTLTRDPFLFHLEMRLRRQEPDAMALVRWAYLGWDTEELVLTIFRRTHKDGHGVLFEVEALKALLERGIKRLWADCQTEPVRYSICPVCRRRSCVCGEKSESQVNAEEAA